MGHLRIIGGAWRGRRLAVPEGGGTRPLPDRVRQSLFDWLGQDLSGLAIADAYAGSGSFGIECASRGAAIVHLIEQDPRALAALRANLARLGHPPALALHAASVEAALPALAGLDLVFLDPPFAAALEAVARALALAAAALAPHGAVLVRGERGRELPLPPALAERERRAYGRSWVAWCALRT